MAAMWMVGPIVICLLLIFFVFRPIGAQMVQQMSRSEFVPVEVPVTTLLESESEPEVEHRPRSRSQILRESVAQRMMQEPEPVVRLVKSWITDDEPAE